MTEDDDCANPGDHALYKPIGGNPNNICECRTREVAAEAALFRVMRASRQPPGRW